MNRFLIALLVFASSALPLNAQSLTPADIKALLAKVHERRMASPHIQADFEEQKTIRLMNKPIVSSGKVWFEPPDKFRREVKGASPSVTISDGHDLWIYYPNFKSAEHYLLGKRSPVDAAIATINTALNMENIENTFHVSGTKIENGYALELVPRSPSMKRIFQKFELRLSNELLAERTEMIQPNGDRVVTNYTNQSRAVIPRSTFEFTPPPGTEITNPMGR